MAKLSRKIIERQARMTHLLPALKSLYPDARCSLDHSSPLELLVATILSAQCTDERVNIVTKTLFKKYKSPRDYASAPPETLERDIQSTGFFRNKAKSIRAMAQSLIDNHNGEVPDQMDPLVALAGVGRKTANVVLGNAFGQNIGVVVDTHVTRLSNRLKLTDHATDAVKIEQDLIQVVPREDWTIFSHLLIAHGRAVCNARKPLCEACRLLPYCPTGPKILAEREAASTSQKIDREGAKIAKKK